MHKEEDVHFFENSPEVAKSIGNLPQAWLVHLSWSCHRRVSVSLSMSPSYRSTHLSTCACINLWHSMQTRLNEL